MILTLEPHDFMLLTKEMTAVPYVSFLRGRVAYF